MQDACLRMRGLSSWQAVGSETALGGKEREWGVEANLTQDVAEHDKGVTVWPMGRYGRE